MPDTLFHPTFLYESLWDLAGVGVLLLLDRRFHFRRGRLFWLYAMYYTLGRGWIELLRIDDAEQLSFFGITARLNVWTSVLVFLVSASVFVLLTYVRPRRTGDSVLLRDKAGDDDGGGGDGAGGGDGGDEDGHDGGGDGGHEDGHDGGGGDETEIAPRPTAEGETTQDRSVYQQGPDGDSLVTGGAPGPSAQMRRSGRRSATASGPPRRRPECGRGR